MKPFVFSNKIKMPSILFESLFSLKYYFFIYYYRYSQLFNRVIIKTFFEEQCLTNLQQWYNKWLDLILQRKKKITNQLLFFFYYAVALFNIIS